MINFKEEIKKYEYILTIDDVGKKVEEDSDKNDILEILEYISTKIEKN